MIKTKIAALLIVGVSLLEIYTFGASTYSILLISAHFSNNIPIAPYLFAFLTYLTPIILTIFILLRKKWAWWIMMFYLVVLIISSLAVIIGSRTGWLVFLYILSFSLRYLPLRFHDLWIGGNWVYFVFVASLVVFILLFLDRKNFFKN